MILFKKIKLNLDFLSKKFFREIFRIAVYSPLKTDYLFHETFFCQTIKHFHIYTLITYSTILSHGEIYN